MTLALLVCVFCFIMTLIFATLSNFDPPALWIPFLLIQAVCILLNVPGVLPA